MPTRANAPAREPTRGEDLRSIAHLKMLHGVSAKLSRLLEIEEIATTIADELHHLIDYHNCRVYLRDGDDLTPVAFRGALTDTTGSVLDVLTLKVGVGVTGHVAATGAPFITGDGANCGIGHHIEGTPRIEESLIAVPLRYGTNVVGVLVLSKLGIDQFDGDDLRFLEVLAGHASVAFANARLYEAERREAHGAKALLELSRELSACTDLDAVAERVVQGAVRILDVPRASLWLPASEDGGLECLSRWPDDDDPAHAHPGDRLPPGALQLLADRTDPFLIRSEDHVATVGPDFNRELAAVYAVAPFPIDGSHGGLALTLDSSETLDGRRLDLLAGIAAQAKLALANARSFESLERTFLSTVEALANALEAKDEYTSSHARWIRDMAVNVGKELGLDAPSLKRVELGALFHDIGKIGIPLEILTKPGPLTDEETALIETHPELGERILAPIEQLEHVRPIVRACHERFDGDGYPDGLRGDEIPLEARIIFVCDAFHAMTTTRPYREALPVEEARRRLLAGAGSQFDPAIVEVCLRVLSRRRTSSAQARGRARHDPWACLARALSGDAAEQQQRAALHLDLGPHRDLPCARLERGVGGRELERPAAPEAHRRQPERERIAPRVEDHEERVVDDGLALVRLGHDLGAVQERPDRRCVTALPVLARHRAAVGPEPPDVGSARVLLLEPRQERRPPEDRVRSPQLDEPLREGMKRSGPVVEVPVEPADLVVLAVGVVVAALGAGELVAGHQHRHAV